MRTRIKINHTVNCGQRYSTNPHVEYPTGTILDVVPASNLPSDSPIAFWVDQDGWQDDAYGFAIYKSDDYTVIEN